MKWSQTTNLNRLSLIVSDHFPLKVQSLQSSTYDRPREQGGARASRHLCFGLARQNAGMATKQLLAERDQLS
jgi:hypothetical protein